MARQQRASQATDCNNHAVALQNRCDWPAAIAAYEEAARPIRSCAVLMLFAGCGPRFEKRRPLRRFVVATF